MENFGAEDLSTIGGIATVSLLHSFIPTHWLPFSIVGRAQKWTLSRTLFVSTFPRFCFFLIHHILLVGIFNDILSIVPTAMLYALLLASSYIIFTDLNILHSGATTVHIAKLVPLKLIHTPQICSTLVICKPPFSIPALPQQDWVCLGH